MRNLGRGFGTCYMDIRDGSVPQCGYTLVTIICIDHFFPFHRSTRDVPLVAADRRACARRAARDAQTGRPDDGVGVGLYRPLLPVPSLDHAGSKYGRVSE